MLILAYIRLLTYTDKLHSTHLGSDCGNFGWVVSPYPRSPCFIAIYLNSSDFSLLINDKNMQSKLSRKTDSSKFAIK